MYFYEIMSVKPTFYYLKKPYTCRKWFKYKVFIKVSVIRYVHSGCLVLPFAPASAGAFSMLMKASRRDRFSETTQKLIKDSAIISMVVPSCLHIFVAFSY